MSRFDETLKDAFLHHYMNQRGDGQYPVFRGYPVQYGTGIGDFFRSIGRFLLPIFASGAKNFIQSTAGGLEQGRTLKEAAKSAIAPTLSGAVGDLSSGVVNKLAGRGRGRKRKSRSKSKSKSAKRRRVYKGKKTKGRRRSKRKSKKFVSFNF